MEPQPLSHHAHIKHIMTSIVILLLIAIAGVGGFYVGRNSGSSWRDAVLAPANRIEGSASEAEALPSPPPTQTEKAETRDLKFLYGQIIEKKERKFLVQQLLLNGTYGATIYLVQADDRTNIEYIPIKKLAGEPGTLDGMKKGMYVFIATRSQLVASPAIYAESISYSEVSPIREPTIGE